jgi:hypothetical protein
VFCCEARCRRTPTPTPAFDSEGRRIYQAKSGQFVIVVEGRPGSSGAPVGVSLDPGVDGRPDLQIQNTRNMGNGSLTVCDTGPASAGGGGVPGINPPRFDPGDLFVTNALNDFACRFDPSVSNAAPCTILDEGREPRLVVASSTAQFCDFVAATAAFPPGENLLTVRLRDVLGNPGPTAQIVVRVPTPTPLASEGGP